MRRRAAAIAVVAVVALAVMAVCVVAGRWQWGRHEDRAEARDAYRAAVGLAPAPLASLVPAGAETLPAGAEWRTASVTGAFQPDSLTLLRNRSVDGVRSRQHLAWFSTGDGAALLVLTGWTPQPRDPSDPADDPLLPADTRTITVVLRAQEPDDGRRDAGATRVAAAHLPPPPAEPRPGYGVLVDGGCARADCAALFGTPVPMAEPTLGPHLAYAVQWWLFAALAPWGAVTLLRADARKPRPLRDSAPRGGRDPSRRGPRRRGPTDEEVEDAL